MRSGRRIASSDRGAAAVEFAIVLPLLLLIVFGVIDFGRMLYSQVTLTQAAREGSRLLALATDPVEVRSRTQDAATGLSDVDVFPVTECPGEPDAVVLVTYRFEFVTPVGGIGSMLAGGGYGDPLDLSAEGVMPCES